MRVYSDIAGGHPKFSGLFWPVPGNRLCGQTLVVVRASVAFGLDLALGGIRLDRMASKRERVKVCHDWFTHICKKRFIKEWLSPGTPAKLQKCCQEGLGLVKIGLLLFVAVYKGMAIARHASQTSKMMPGRAQARGNLVFSYLYEEVYKGRAIAMDAGQTSKMRLEGHPGSVKRIGLKQK